MKTPTNPTDLMKWIDTYLEIGIDNSPVDLRELLKLIKGDNDNLRILELGIKIGFLDFVEFTDSTHI